MPPPKIEVTTDWGDLAEIASGGLRLELSEEESKDLLGDIVAEITAAEDARRERIQTVQKVRSRFYLAKPNRKPLFPEGANWHVPFTRWVLDAVGARLWRELFGVSDTAWVVVRGVRGQQDVDRASRLEPRLHYINQSELHLDDVYDEAIERVLTDGVVYAKVPWRRTVRPVRRRRFESFRIQATDPQTKLPLLDPETGGPIIRIVQRYAVSEREEETYHGPTCDLVSIENLVFPDVNEADLNKQPWVAQQFFLSRELLWNDRERTVELDGATQTVGRYRNVEQVIAPARREDTSAHGTERAHQVMEKVAGTQLTGSGLVEQARCYEILWPYRAWKIAKALRAGQKVDHPERQWPDRVLVTFAFTERVLLDARRYPYWDPWPEHLWVRIVAIDKAGRAYPPSLGEILMPVQDELDTIHWQRTDATTVMIMAFFTFLAEEGAADDLDRITLGAKNVISSIDGVKLLADVVRIAIQVPGLDVENLVLKFGELLAGISDPQLGRVVSGDPRTAFEIGTVVREGAVKFVRMLAALSRGIVQIDQLALRRYAQFYPLVAPKLLRLRADQQEPEILEELALADLDWTPDLVLRGVSIAVNKEMQAAKALRVLQLSEQSAFIKLMLLSNPDGVYNLVSQVFDQIDWPGGVQQLLGPKDKAVKASREITQLLGASMFGGGQGPPGQQPGGNRVNGQRGANAAMNDSGLAAEAGQIGAQLGGTSGG